MLVNADFSRRAIVAPDLYQWTPSPQEGVDRVMLDRVGGEKARATSIVRYAPGSSFPQHQHPGGEEILVVSGTFSEGNEHYPAGWYLRNPPGSAHQPSSSEGATIFVKLWQMQSDEATRVRIDTRNPSAWRHQDGREVCPLFCGATEQVCLQRLTSHEMLFTGFIDGAELLVLAGEVMLEGRAYERGSWIRLPQGNCPAITTGAQGATYYLKTGHMADIPMKA